MDGRVYLICPLGFVEVPVENGEWGDPSCQFQCFFSKIRCFTRHGVIKHGVLKNNHLVRWLSQHKKHPCVDGGFSSLPWPWLPEGTTRNDRFWGGMKFGSTPNCPVPCPATYIFCDGMWPTKRGNFLWNMGEFHNTVFASSVWELYTWLQVGLFENEAYFEITIVGNHPYMFEFFGRSLNVQTKPRKTYLKMQFSNVSTALY